MTSMKNGVDTEPNHVYKVIYRRRRMARRTEEIFWMIEELRLR